MHQLYAILRILNNSDRHLLSSKFSFRNAFALYSVLRVSSSMDATILGTITDVNTVLQCGSRLMRVPCSMVVEGVTTAYIIRHRAEIKVVACHAHFIQAHE